MKFFAIRRKADKAWLPAIVGKRCSTRAEPSQESAPRLFLRKIDAVNALNWWEKGVWKMIRTGGYSGFGYDQDPLEELHVDPDVSRKKEDFEILEVFVSVRRKA